MSESKKRLEITCPCCAARLVVDAETGLVLHKEGKKPDLSFEEALEKEKSRKARSDDMFRKAFDQERQRHSALNKKFEEALRSKDELDDPGPRPWDYD